MNLQEHSVRYKWTARLIGTGVIVIIFFWLGRRLYIDWQELKDYEWHVQPFWLGLSCAVLIAWWIALSIGWLSILRRLKSRLSLKKGFKFWAISQLGRYLPGKIWYILGRTYLCSREDISKPTVLASTILEAILMTTGAGFAFFLALPIMMNIQSANLLYYLSVIPVGMVIVHPLLFSRAFNSVTRKLKGTEIQFDLSYLHVLSFVAVYTFLWLLCGLAFFLFVNSIYRVGWIKLIPVAGTFAIAWMIGFLSFVTPGGLGVREGTLTILLANYIPAPMAVVVALLSRIWFVAAEVVCAAVAWRL